MSETIVFTQHQKLLPLLEMVWLVGSERGKRFLLTGGRQTFGRSDDNNIILPDTTISNHHGVLVYAGEGEVLFYDTASRNGISLDGRKATIIKVKVGQQLQIGSVYLKLVKAGQEIDAAVPEIKRSHLTKGKLWAVGAVAILTLLPILFRSHHQQTMLERPPVPAAPVVGKAHIPSDSRPTAGAKIKKARSFERKAVAASRPESFRGQGKGKLAGLVQAGQLEERAEVAFQGGRFAEAYSLWRQVLSVDSSSQPAQEGLKKLETMAGKFYEEALMVKGSAPERSRQKLELALAISAPGSEIHQRVQDLMKGQG